MGQNTALSKSREWNSARIILLPMTWYLTGKGRSFSSHGYGRSAIEPHSDPHRQLKTKFAHRLADVLARELEHGRYHLLILVAAPATLGDLRATISSRVQSAIIGEIAQDLTKAPNHEIRGHLKDSLLSSEARNAM